MTKTQDHPHSEAALHDLGHLFDLEHPPAHSQDHPGERGNSRTHDHSHDHGHTHHEHEGHEHHHHDHASPTEDERPIQEVAPVITVRSSSGLSGDMMLSGLAGLAGLDNTELNTLVGELRLPALERCLSIEARSVNHIAGIGCAINLPHEHAHRNLADIVTIINNSDMPERARTLSIQAFTLLAEAEAAVHGKQRNEVTFHEVGALDSILDTCLVCRLFTILAPSRFICSPLPLADGAIYCAHGFIPSPAPAVLRLLENVPVCGFRGRGETVTPTAIALLKALGAEFGSWPAITVMKTVISYGGRVFEDAPNGAIWALGK